MSLLITEVDRARLQNCLQWLPLQLSRTAGIGVLEQRLAAATIVASDSIPRDQVTMNSHVRIRYIKSGEEIVVHLAYPPTPMGDDDGPRPVSVISPVGATILGTRVGDLVEWKAPAGVLRGKVVEVTYQPEAFGDPD